MKTSLLLKNALIPMLFSLTLEKVIRNMQEKLTGKNTLLAYADCIVILETKWKIKLIDYITNQKKKNIMIMT